MFIRGVFHSTLSLLSLRPNRKRFISHDTFGINKKAIISFCTDEVQSFYNTASGLLKRYTEIRVDRVLQNDDPSVHFSFHHVAVHSFCSG